MLVPRLNQNDNLPVGMHADKIILRLRLLHWICFFPNTQVVLGDICLLGVSYATSWFLGAAHQAISGALVKSTLATLHFRWRVVLLTSIISLAFSDIETHIFLWTVEIVFVAYTCPRFRFDPLISWFPSYSEVVKANETLICQGDSVSVSDFKWSEKLKTNQASEKVPFR